MTRFFSVLLVFVALLLSSCGQTTVGGRTGLFYGFNKIEEASMTSGPGPARSIEVVDEKHTPAIMLGLNARHVFPNGLFIEYEPAIRLGNKYTSIFKVKGNDDPPHMTEITREHTSIDLPIVMGWLIEGTTFDLTVGVGAGLTTALSSSQTTYGFTEVNGTRTSRSWRGANSDGGSDYQQPIFMGVLGLEKQIDPVWILGFDLRYMSSTDGFYTRPGQVYEPNHGSSEHYSYSAPYKAFSFTVGASMIL